MDTELGGSDGNDEAPYDEREPLGALEATRETHGRGFGAEDVCYVAGDREADAATLEGLPDIFEAKGEQVGSFGSGRGCGIVGRRQRKTV